jgi:Phage integrase family
MNTATLAATTRADSQSLLDRHVIDDIGTIPLSRLRARDCDEFHASTFDRPTLPGSALPSHISKRTTGRSRVGFTSPSQPARDAAKSAPCDGPTSTSTRAPSGSNAPSPSSKAPACRSRQPKLATSDLDKERVHDLRHFVATELLTAGIDVRTVANRLGHARTSTTLDIYWAWVPAQDQRAAHHLETVLDQGV